MYHKALFKRGYAMERQSVMFTVDLSTGYVSILLPINIFIGKLADGSSIRDIVIPPEVVKKIGENIEDAIMNLRGNDSGRVH